MQQWIQVIIALIFVYVLNKWIMRKRRRNELYELIAQRRLEREINFQWAETNSSLLDKVEAERITSLDFFQLRRQLHTKKLLPSQVLRAYQRKALEVNNDTNSVCMFIVRAKDIAKSLDEHESPQDLPFYGIPVSIKESLHVRSMDSTSGYASKLKQPCSHDSKVVEQLIAMGAVPFVHTNVPQALLSFGCTNPIYGSTRNPYDSNRVPGGSSGGEAALIALNGSPLGIGTDVGGSIRTPASFCGLIGIKSSSKRTSLLGVKSSIPGRQLLVAVDGPIAPSVDVCVEYLKNKWNSEPLDVYMPPVKFQSDLYESKSQLTLGYYTFDGYQTPAPAYQRAVEYTCQILREKGHRLVEFQIPKSREIFDLFCAGATSDGGCYLNRSLDEDIVPPECYIGFPVTKLPYFIQKLLRKWYPVDRIRNLLNALPHDCQEMRQMHADIEEYRHKFVVEMKKQSIDALVCPAFATLPPRHGTPNRMISATSYTALFNLLDFAAATIPVTRVTSNDDHKTTQMIVHDEWDRLIKNESMNCQGLPVSVQIAAPPNREEICLRILKEIESTIHAHTS